MTTVDDTVADNVEKEPEDKKKKSAKKTKKINSIEDVITAEFGDILFSGDSVVNSTSVIIPVSPAIDLMLGGGIPEGSIVITTGLHKLGKTSMCLHFAGNAQNKKYASELSSPDGRHVYFFNVEGRIKKRDLAGIAHLNTSKERFTIIGSVPGRVLTAENYIDIAEKLVNERPGSIFIFDSFSALCTEDEYSSEIGAKRRDNTPGLLARFCRRISNVLPINKSIFMGVTHLMANQGFGMSQWSEGSGQKIQYHSDVKLMAKFKQPWKIGESQIGQEVNWNCDWSAIGPPGNKAKSKLRYNYGLDKEAEIIDLCVDFGLVKKGGAWYTIGEEYTGGEEEKFQGLENIRTYLAGQPELFIRLNTEVRDMAGLPQV